MESVVVLGATGMLGSMVHQYLTQVGSYDVVGSIRADERERVTGSKNFIEFDATASDTVLEQALAPVQPRWIINCIGIIKPYCKDDDGAGVRNAIVVNALFPFRLAVLAQRWEARVIQIATDCVFSGYEGKYDEHVPHNPLDAYGKTKSLGEVKADNVLHVRCSIIGPEPWTKLSLLAWFLNQPDGSQVQGFTDHQWNGVTTLQFAQCCHRIMSEEPDFFGRLRTASPVHHYVPNETVNKFELLEECASVFGRKVTVTPASSPGPPIDRSLTTTFNLLTPKPGAKRIHEALRELKEYSAGHL